MKEHFLFIRSLITYLDRLESLLGDDWPSFRAELARLPLRLERAADDETLQQIMDRVWDMEHSGPAADFFHTLYRQIQRANIGPATRALSITDETGQSREVDLSAVGETVQRAEVIAAADELRQLLAGNGVEVMILDSRLTGGDHSVIGSHAGRDINTGDIIPEKTTARYLNAGFFEAEGSAPLPDDQPLALDGGPYRLGVNVGQFWGPGAADDAIPEQLLAPLFENRPVVEMQVAATSPDMEIAPSMQTLSLPETGDSRMVFFDLSLPPTGDQPFKNRRTVTVDLLYQGHMIQSRRLEVTVVERVGDPAVLSAFPAQDGYTIFTRTVALDPEALRPLAANPRRLTIVAEREAQGFRLGLRYFTRDGGESHPPRPTNLENAKLTSHLEALRRQLADTVRAYKDAKAPTETLLTEHLGRLADAGRSFYHDLQLASLGPIKPETVIQVAPLSSQLSVPWELLYERKIESYREGRIRLCPTFREHGPAPEDCPNHNDRTVVCPHGFWGYRYIIEQIPRRLAPHAPPPPHSLPVQIRNLIPLQLAALVYRFTNLADHLQGLASTGPITFFEPDHLDHIRDILTQEQADIVYFYAHGGRDQSGTPYLKVSTKDEVYQIKRNDLDAWEVRFEAHPPLIILNACGSAEYTPASIENLLQFFCDAGAVGIIGTQCEVNTTLVDTFMRRFFPLFLQQTPAGQALFQARRSLLRECLDPRGLVYSLFAAAEVHLAQPVLP